jgi:hypothetical protein
MAAIAAFAPSESTETTLWHSRRSFGIASSAPAPRATALVTGSESSERARAALCVGRDGLLVYAEVSTALDPTRDGPMLAGVLDRSGCGQARLFFRTGDHFAIGAQQNLAGHPLVLPSDAPRLVRRAKPDTARLFPETPVLPRAKWFDLQRQQRFFPRENADAPVGG